MTLENYSKQYAFWEEPNLNMNISGKAQIVFTKMHNNSRNIKSCQITVHRLGLIAQQGYITFCLCVMDVLIAADLSGGAEVY